MQVIKIISNFASAMRKENQIGALAHLARAFDWQSRGDEFESRMLHKINQIQFKLFLQKTESDLFIGFKGNRLMPVIFFG